ncbi:uncharacterized protein IL334_005809 [Kwoniella shivajii]|uniref:HNH nuclease domain-containing protein n=1 Tax=Kwoniella shivajii TaxID=564305 RepID=A0ABZ1D465_9TREE|nr:hypothetical protein IL334_005809 [Kwoniella shivajii]
MSNKVSFGDICDFIDLEEDPLPLLNNDQNYVAIVNGQGELAGIESVEDKKSRESRVKRIAQEIEVLLKYRFHWEDDVPLGFKPSKGKFKWSWDKSWAFYYERFVRLKEHCNRNFELEDNVAPMTLWLTHLWFTAKHAGRCHVLGVTLRIAPKNPARVSFGKRRHHLTMSTGWSNAVPQALADFDEAQANIVPESWAANLLRGNKPREHIEEVVKRWAGLRLADGYGGQLTGDFTGLRMDDNVVPVVSAPNPEVSSVVDKHTPPAESAQLTLEVDTDAKAREELLQELLLLGNLFSIKPEPGDIRELLTKAISTRPGSTVWQNLLQAAMSATSQPYDPNLWAVEGQDN